MKASKQVKFIILFILLSITLFPAYAKYMNLKPINLNGNYLSCTGTCIQDISQRDNSSLILNINKNILEIRYDKPFGNWIIKSLKLNLSIKSCTSTTKCKYNGRYSIYGWKGGSWNLIKEFSGDFSGEIEVKRNLDYDNGYRLKLENINSPILKVDQISLTGNFESFEKSFSLNDFYRNNELLIKRIFTTILLITLVFLIYFGIKKYVKFKRKESENILDEKIKKYNEIREEIEKIDVELKAIENARKEVQRKFYNTKISENTFKELMQKYEQKRLELKNKKEELNKILKSMVIE